MPVKLERPDGTVQVTEVADGKRRVEVTLPSGARLRRDTGYPPELVESILDVRGAHYLCDELARDEDPGYVQRALTFAILAYVDEAELAGKRLLDVGCGCGSSTLILSRMFPDTEILGVELVPEYVRVATERASFYGAPHVSFEQSPDGESLPPDAGDFDFIVLSAVYEHLLPDERQSLLPTLWSRLRPGGILFVDQLPYRWSPVERHTTGLPLINYLPDRAALAVARRFGRETRRDEPWEELLRRGIRGGSPRTILATLGRQPGNPQLLEPSRLGLRDRVDAWHALSSGSRWPALKTGLKAIFKAVRRTTGVTVVPFVTLAIRKT